MGNGSLFTPLFFKIYILLVLSFKGYLKVVSGIGYKDTHESGYSVRKNTIIFSILKDSFSAIIDILSGLFCGKNSSFIKLFVDFY
jgi:hypothetical protein